MRDRLLTFDGHRYRPWTLAERCAALAVMVPIAIVAHALVCAFVRRGGR